MTPEWAVNATEGNLKSVLDCEGFWSVSQINIEIGVPQNLYRIVKDNYWITNIGLTVPA